MTGHGFRGLASTLLNEHEFDEAHIELQLAHTKRNKVAAAYNHAKYLKQLTEMMQWWADYLDEKLAKGRKGLESLSPFPRWRPRACISTLRCLLCHRSTSGKPRRVGSLDSPIPYFRPHPCHRTRPKADRRGKTVRPDECVQAGLRQASNRSYLWKT